MTRDEATALFERVYQQLSILPYNIDMKLMFRHSGGIWKDQLDTWCVEVDDERLKNEEDWQQFKRMHAILEIDQNLEEYADAARAEAEREQVMIYTFDAVRTITARIAVEAATTKEAQEIMLAATLQNSDYPQVEEESIHLHAAYETCEGAIIAEPFAQHPRWLYGKIDQVSAFEKRLTADEIRKHFEQSAESEQP